MCQIQSMYFLVDGSVPQPPCLAHGVSINSNIEMEADVEFFNDEVGQQIYCYFVVKFPDGGTQGVYANNGNPYNIGSPRTYTFVASDFISPGYLTGNYTIQSVTILRYDKQATLCWGTTTKYGCLQISTVPPPCTPNWICEQPLNGYEKDGCGNRRTNSICNPCTPNWTCEQPLNGYEKDGCGNRRTNSICNPVYVLLWKASGKGKIAVYKNGVFVDNIIADVPMGTAKTFTFNIGDTLKYQAFPDSGWAYDTTCDSTGCDSSNPFEATITKAMWNTFTSNFAQLQYHNECINNICTKINTPGTDQCSTVGASCGATPTHSECINNICTQVLGTGTNKCDTIGAACGTQPVQGCPNCNPLTNYCIANTCIPKKYVLYGAVGLFALMLLKK